MKADTAFFSTEASFVQSLQKLSTEIISRESESFGVSFVPIKRAPLDITPHSSIIDSLKKKFRVALRFFFGLCAASQVLWPSTPPSKVM